MKKFLRFALLALISLTAMTGLNSCGEKAVEENSFEQTSQTGSLGYFSLTSPSLGASLTETPTFEWSAAENASYYTLEIASTKTFVTNDDSCVYYKKDYIQATSFTIGSNLAQKDVTYYWRVTAHSGAKTLACNNNFNFYLASVDLGEVAFPIGDTIDWSVHEQGNPVSLSLDNSNFFSNDQESLVMSFSMEQTKTIGWSVITKTVEKDTYGSDSLYLRFFYSGDDATAYIRLRDNDGEFWRHKIELSNNSKQVCIMPFSEFTQDTELVTVANHTFDYFHIKYMEIVFEQTWGDGVCLVSQIKTIKKSNYQNLFIDKLNFKDYPTSTWAWENNYDFGFNISEDGSSYTLDYSSVNMSGYGFAKIPANRFFDTGDMVKMKVKYSGTAGGNMSFRLKEEDGDYWYYMQPFSTLSTEDYTDVYIPFAAFVATYLGGNGRREFSWISQLQFGLTNMYGKGTLTYKDVEIVTMSEQTGIATGNREVGTDGVIEDFNSYANAAQPYYQWSLSTSNKDEFITLNSAKAIGSGNTYCGQFAYKADMSAATYTLPLSVSKTDGTGLSLWIKDASVKSDNTVFSYLTSVSAHTYIYLKLNTGAIYYYDIASTPKVWTEYDIPFKSFTLSSSSTDETAITSAAISTLVFAFQYVYYTQAGVAYPTYMQSNPVYLDNIKIVSDEISQVGITAKERTITMDSSSATTATIENAENYASTADVLNSWNYGNDNTANNLELSDDVSSEGGKHSLKMNYKSYSTVNYSLPTTVDASLGANKPKGLVLDLKGDGKATVYINLYLMIGSSIYQVRKNVTNIPTSWTRYSIGFDMFTDYVTSTSVNVNANNIAYLYKITFGLVNSDYSASAVYMDNMKFDTSITRSTYSNTALS